VSTPVLVAPVPLSSVETEQALLGAVLIHPSVIALVEPIVVASDFSEPVHRDLFTKFLETLHEGYSITPRIVSATLGSLGVQSICNIPVKAYVARLAAAAAHAGEAPELARAIRDLAQRRALVSIAEQLKCVIENDAPVLHTAGAAIEALDEIIASRSAAHTQSVWIGEAAIGSIDRMVAAIQAPGNLPGITTGFRDLDERTGGFQRGEFVVLAGRPGMGKSALAITMARLMAQAGHNVLLNSLEMDSYSVADRAMTDIAWQELDPIEYSRLRSGKVTLSQQQRLTDAARAFTNLPIRVDPQSGLKLSHIAARARKHKQSLERQGKTLDALIVDHMHIVAPSNRYAGQAVREVTETSGALKALAKELNLPVIAPAQLNRSVEGRGNKRPTLSDLRESGAIEQDADLIAFVFREAYYLANISGNDAASDGKRARFMEVVNVVEVNIAKQRNGPVGAVELFCHIGCNVFRDREKTLP
jgi:replicative DNA helicase